MGKSGADVLPTTVPENPVLHVDPAEDRVINTVVIIYAMAAEAAPLVELLKLTKTSNAAFPKGSPWALYSGSHDGITVDVIIPGKDKALGVDNVGTVPAAVVTYAAIQALKPDIVINAGTAGGFKAKGAQIGDVYLATHMANHDRRIPLPGFDKYGVGEIVAATAPNMVKELGLKEGKVSTGNSFDITERDQEYISANDAVIKDMEAAAIAWVAQQLEIPMISLKSVTDIVDGDRPTSEEFLENLHTAAASLRDMVPRVVKFVSGRRLSQL